MIQVVGVSAALPAHELDPFTQGKDEVKAYLRDVYGHLERELRKHTGETKPQGSPSFQIDGPNESDLLGVIYVASLGVPVEINDLPLDCTAYAAHHEQRRAMEGVIHLAEPLAVDLPERRDWPTLVSPVDDEPTP